ncbi:hypothetical protein CO115_05345 [Candidatus Falkowbacteria bacterium CG_4_9_14_3_um_filter_36_9]|uniref:Uncharacterized protein n=2 Tax=Candidatus Falkowiibacteriota TaxID=1752728 RepID=A0A1J4T728_9BACT|nr:MAG: hypothetical protein AUJ27_02155 [Candidatus Falkowbacteria bacterium CG1_02_37_44]PIV51596.1 MAG: hypothetical protein COS18_02460 [Candidatus Falkowbacteria bacterium CG02_land_8_20_14_3_00_36_14]PIX12212.1 MAG: hypothetical protein COZ73_00715 [Candidatus Falkowbacteria bacterium CG_4_8_14_3_um_filter_36_11]PJA11252.1 MAG: hypothetical protein COX67_00775 [Candidatus Falkowbacteria bacterium CG_4_10_14_0_2_um_filter_36_22]PJB17864.1 MAG: hypothetical protein CO115_05345 [Candidatus F
MEEVSDEELSQYDFAGNIQYRPGVYLVKIQTDPKVYAVSNNGVLNWIKTESLAARLYGEKWNLLVDDIPDSFFVNYSIGDQINDENEYDPDDEEEQTPSLDYNLGIKKQNKIIKKEVK